MALGAVLASFMGTTGASMLLIRPLIRANDNRRTTPTWWCSSSSSSATSAAR
jgi:Na+/H+ antiporter NhaD/arsenite permease-like protein